MEHLVTLDFDVSLASFWIFPNLGKHAEDCKTTKENIRSFTSERFWEASSQSHAGYSIRCRVIFDKIWTHLGVTGEG